MHRAFWLERLGNAWAIEQNAALDSFGGEVFGARYLNHPASPLPPVSSRCNSWYGASSDHPSVLTSDGYGLRQMLIQYWMNQPRRQVHNTL